MKLDGRRQSTNVEVHTKNGNYDGNGNRIHSYGQSGQLTRNGKTYNSNYDNRGKTYGGSGGSGGSSRVICTHFFKKGMLDRDVWKADLAFTFANLSPQTIRGYHLWAIPYVRLMRRSRVAEAVMYPIAKARAEELAYQMGTRDKPNYAGKLVRWIGEPICFAFGYFVGEQNWQGLWDKNEVLD